MNSDNPDKDLDYIARQKLVGWTLTLRSKDHGAYRISCYDTSKRLGGIVYSSTRLVDAEAVYLFLMMLPLHVILEIVACCGLKVTK